MHIFIHSNNRLFGECLAAGLSTLSEVEAAIYLDSSATLGKRAVSTQHPNFLIDQQTPNAGDIARRIKSLSPQACILALAVDQKDPANVVDCARLGFEAIVPSGAPVDAVPGYIRKARRGEVVLPPQATASLFRALATPQESASLAPTEGMTRREREICLLVCDGLTNKEIARELDRSVGTVKNHIHAILSKLDVPRRGAIAARVLHSGAALPARALSD